MMAHVITYNGEKVPREKTRRIKGTYYKVGNPKVKDSGGCYLLTDATTGKEQYYRINSGLIAWDYEKKEYFVKRASSEVVKGIVKMEGGVAEEGYFTYNPAKNCILSGGDVSSSPLSPTDTYVLDEEVLDKRVYKESTIDGKFYDRKKMPASFFRPGTTNPRIRHSKFPYLYLPTDRYNFKEYPNSLLDTLEKNKREYTEPTPVAAELSELIGDLSFGFEAETFRGHVPERYLFQNGIVPLKDGSIEGHEYTSLPLKGARGVQTVINFFKILNKYTISNEFCSLHYHIGNVLEKYKSDKEQQLFIIALYILYYRLQDEIWDIFPSYKKDLQYFIRKRGAKDHCQNLKSLGLLDNKIYQDGKVHDVNLTKSFKTLYTFMNDGEAPKVDYWRKRVHCKHDRPKWHILSRYYNINFYNMFFGNSNTVEFRAHSGTTNPHKAMAWLLICIGIVKYAMNNTKKIIECQEKFNLFDIADGYRTKFGEYEEATEFSNFVADYLTEYIQYRKDKFVQSFLNHDMYSDEFKKDNNFSLVVQKRTLIE